MPFHTITNIELLHALESVENNIKLKLQNQNFQKLIEASIPTFSENKTLPNCKYYTSEEFSQNLASRQSNNISLLHHNIRSLDKNYGELIALINSLGNNFDFIALSEIRQKNIESRKTL